LTDIPTMRSSKEEETVLRRIFGAKRVEVTGEYKN
jgi:hypothetical protein